MALTPSSSVSSFPLCLGASSPETGRCSARPGLAGTVRSLAPQVLRRGVGVANRDEGFGIPAAFPRGQGELGDKSR